MNEPKNQKHPGHTVPTIDYEQQLINYQNKITNILESFTDAFFEIDKNWIVTYWNKEAERLMQMPRDKIIGRNLQEVFHDAIPLKFFSEYQKAFDYNIAVRFEEFFQPRNLWVEVAGFPSGSGLSVYFKDITANKSALAMLEGERQKYNDLFSQSPLPQWVYDFETLKFLDVNEAAIAHYGYSRAEFMQMSIKDIRLQSDVASLEKILHTEVVNGFLNKSSVIHKKKSGEMISVCVEGNSVFFEGKNARLVIIVDRTAEIKAAKDVEESVQRFNIVSKATSDAIWDYNLLTGNIVWNKGIKGIFGHKHLCYTKDWWEDHIHPEDLGKVLAKVNLLFRNHKARSKMEYRFRCADGSYRFVLDRSFTIYNSDRLPVRMIGSIQDITDRVNAMKSVKDQNSRLKEISWIQSHKVRSPLARIMGLVSLMSLSKTDLQAINELLPMLVHSADELDHVLKEIVQKT